MQYSKQFIANLKSTFVKNFDKNPQFVFSPGRINLIGEHTDYNDGYVMPAAIDKGIYYAFEKNNDNIIRLISIDYDQKIEINLDAVQPVSIGWANYVLGVVAEIKKLIPISSGFDIVFGGDIPIGAGLSSSAALACGTVFSLNHLFRLDLKKIQLIKIAQQAEHRYVGVHCGIMDQFACIMGKENNTILLDCRSLEYSYFISDFGDYQLLLFNSKVKHSLAGSEYNKRREECETGVMNVQIKYPEVTSLRDICLEMLSSIQDKVSAEVYNRCSYVIEENQRVLMASKFLKNKDFTGFGMLLYDSHQGLSEKYKVSCKELDFLVEFAKRNPAILGARMMGGGFGGCTINLVKRNKKTEVIALIQKKYLKTYNSNLECYEIEVKDGTHLIKADVHEYI